MRAPPAGAAPLPQASYHLLAPPRPTCRLPPLRRRPGLDPTWEEEFEFDVKDEATDRCFVKFLMGAEGEEKQIGDECECVCV